MATLGDFINNGQQRRAWLDENVADFVEYITPPNLRPAAEFAAQVNPIQGMSDSMAQFGVATDPTRSMEDRRNAAIGSAVEGLLAVAPAAVAAKMGRPAAEGVIDTLAGYAPDMDDALGRFWADEAGSIPVGRTPENPMIAHHNLSSGGVGVAADIGGIPMPSMAISRADAPLTGYGDITLLADPSMVKPSRTTGVWGDDVYTGRQPRGDVEFVSDRAASKAMGADPDFGHFRDATYWMDAYDDFERSNELMQLAQRGLDMGMDPKDFDDFTSYARAVQNEVGWSTAEHAVTQGYPGLSVYGDTRRVLYPRDLFTPSGNRRKPSDYTLDRVMKYMRAENAGFPATETISTGPGEFRAVSTSPFRSMSDIKSARGNLMPEDDTKAARESFNDAYWDLRGRLSQGDDYRASDRAGELMQDIAQGRSYRDWYDGELSDDVISGVRALSQSARELPAAYFEAKPRRAVTLDEFPAAIVPANDAASAEALRSAGVKDVLTYSTPEERVELFRKFPELLFSGAGAAGLFGLLSPQEQQGGI